MRDYNVGLLTGHAGPESIVVVDIDVGPDFDERIAELRLPETWTVRSGRGGLHCYFALPNDVDVRNSQGRLARKVDVRGTGGFIVAPGSISPDTGAVYSWEPGLGPGEVALAELPEHIIEAAGGAGGRGSAEAVDQSEGYLSDAQKRRVLVHSDCFREIPGASAGARNGTAFELACRGLRVMEGSADAVWASLERWGARCSPPITKEADPQEYKALYATFRSALATYERDRSEDLKEDRPLIVLGDNLRRVVSLAEEETLRRYPPGHRHALYQRGGVLVHAVHDEAGLPELRPIPFSTLREILSTAARFRKEGTRREPIFPPNEVVSALRDRGEWHFPRIESIREAPFFRADGSICKDVGYDRSSLSLAFWDVEAWDKIKIIDQPDRATAQRALEYLKDPLQDFPFSAEGSWDAAIAIALTIVARQAIDGPTPLFAIRAHQPGSGKTLLVNAAGIMAMGRGFKAGQEIKGEDDTRKKLLAVAVRGQTTCLLDNVRGVFGNSALSAAITADEIEDRVLGVSEMRDARWRTVIVATGNNMRFTADQARRTVTVDMDPSVERPEFRSGFKYRPLLDHLRDNQRSYLAALLALVRAHRVAGQPIVTQPLFGGFEAWDHCVRQAILWAGGADILATRFQLGYLEDQEATRARVLIHVWRELFGIGEPISAKELAANARLRDALEELYEELTPRSMGCLLREVQGRVVGGVRVMKMDRPGRGALWRLVPVRV